MIGMTTSGRVLNVGVVDGQEEGRSSGVGGGATGTSRSISGSGWYSAPQWNNTDGRMSS